MKRAFKVKKTFSSVLKDFQLPEVVSDLRCFLKYCRTKKSQRLKMEKNLLFIS